MEDTEKGLRHLRHIDKELGDIRDRTGNPWMSFRNGILQGMGAIVGSVLAVALIGWVLSFFGIIPGFGHIATYLHSLVDRTPTRL